MRMQRWDGRRRGVVVRVRGAPRSAAAAPDGALSPESCPMPEAVHAAEAGSATATVSSTPATWAISTFVAPSRLDAATVYASTPSTRTSAGDDTR